MKRLLALLSSAALLIVAAGPARTDVQLGVVFLHGKQRGPDEHTPLADALTKAVLSGGSTGRAHLRPALSGMSA